MPLAQIPGLQLYYDEEGRGTPVILAHGGFEDMSAYDSQREAISKNYRLIRYDRRGCGRSAPKGLPNAPDLWVEDHRAFMEALGLDSAVVGGVSFGGMLTIELMVRYPHLLKGAIIISATAGDYQGLPDYDAPFPKWLEELKRVQVPTLMIHGTEDAIFPITDAEATAGALSNAELALLKGGPQINQDNLEGFNKTVLGWAGPAGPITSERGGLRGS